MEKNSYTFFIYRKILITEVSDNFCTFGFIWIYIKFLSKIEKCMIRCFGQFSILFNDVEKI